MRWALVLLLLAPSLVMAQDEGAQLAAPNPGAVEVTEASELRARWRALGYDGNAATTPATAPTTTLPPGIPPAFVHEHARRLELREQRMQARLELRERYRDAASVRRQFRVEHPFTLRLEAFWTITPRAINGFGPYDGNDGYAGYPGLGAGLVGSKWLTRAVRVDLRAAFAWVTRDAYLDYDHGPEGTLGVAIGLHSAGRRRMGIGLGIDAIMAREVDAAADGHFRWLGIRGVVVAEMGFITARGNGLVLKMAPTFTWAPYATHPFPGIVSGLAVEWTP